MNYLGIDPGKKGGIILELPWPPSMNTYWRRKQGQHRLYISPKGKEFRNAVLVIVDSEQFPRANGELRFEMDLYPPNRRAVDLDNRIKAVQDALQDAGVFDDDSQIVDLNVCKRDVIKGGKAVVRVTELTT